MSLLAIYPVAPVTRMSFWGCGHSTQYFSRIRIRTGKDAGAGGKSAGEAGEDEFVEGPHGIPI